ncbi:EAL domain-containing protein [Paroceanicella profunda]|uniref:EAL domain-containing protein n=1 Tax=Paroceanicella profunda TaxID=2579971 RepID=A0A5B8FZN7_9RHOB|nr:EAL domain-containing protein [Paroceanicella profunda]QDL91743.1 EAL domain-containing protein [Paroceanicella profunda]
MNDLSRVHAPGDGAVALGEALREAPVALLAATLVSLANLALCSLSSPNVWIPTGLAVALLCARPGTDLRVALPAALAGLGLGGLGGAVLFDSPVATAPVRMFELLLAVGLLRLDRSFGPARDMAAGALRLLGAQLLLVPAATALALRAGMAAWPEQFGAVSPEGWWAGSLAGMVMLAPVGLGYRYRHTRRLRTARWLGWTATLVVASMAVSATALLLFAYPFVVISLPMIAAALFCGPLRTGIVGGASVGTILALAVLGLRVEATPEQFAMQAIAVALATVPPFLLSLLREDLLAKKAGIRRSDEIFRRAMQDSAIGMAIVGPDGRFLRINDALERMLGYTPEVLSALTFEDITHPDDLSHDKELLRELVSGKRETYRYEKRYRHADGRYVWGQLAVSLVRRESDGGVDYFISQIVSTDDRKRAEAELTAAHERLDLAVSAANVGIWEYDIETGVTTWDARMHALYGTRPGAFPLQRGTWAGLAHPDDAPLARSQLQQAIESRGRLDMTVRMRRPGMAESWRTMRTQGHFVPGNDGPDRMLGTHWDITEDVLLTEALYQEKERLRITLTSIGDAVVSTDAEGNVLFLNPVAARLLGYRLEEVEGRPLSEIFHLVEEDTLDPVASPVEACLRTGMPQTLPENTLLVSRSGNHVPITDSAAPVRTADGTVVGAVLVFQDTTNTRALQRELAYRARRDPLTGLLNRFSFEETLEATHAQMQRDRRPFALCYIDLDRFKIVNDTAGHQAGDRLLRDVARLMATTLRAQDRLARIGGDEFAVILPDCTRATVESVCRRILEAVRDFRFAWEGESYAVSASIGIAMITDPAMTPQEIVQQADVACYAAKSSGRDRLSLYDEATGDAGRRHREIQVASGIREAIEQDRLVLYAQDIVPLQPGAAPGARHIEVLVRLRDREGHIHLPAAFIPAAERYDLMGNVDRWVISRVLERHGREIGALPGGWVAINLSANSLNDPTLGDFLRDALAQSGMPPERLCLEITETALISNLTEAKGFVEAMRGLGVRLALDDFGTGLSSFSYLRQFPVDYVKIDGAFVSNIATSKLDRRVVESINDISHAIGAQTIAEFVGSQEVTALLADIGVDFGQGHHIGHPRPISDCLQTPAHWPQHPALGPAETLQG